MDVDVNGEVSGPAADKAHIRRSSMGRPSTGRAVVAGPTADRPTAPAEPMRRAGASMRTSVMATPPKPRPVFHDATGRRRRRVRLVLFVTALVVVAAALIGWLSLSATVHPAPVTTCTGNHHGCRR